jgi:hypothetical protein
MAATDVTELKLAAAATELRELSFLDSPLRTAVPVAMMVKTAKRAATAPRPAPPGPVGAAAEPVAGKAGLGVPVEVAPMAVRRARMECRPALTLREPAAVAVATAALMGNQRLTGSLSLHQSVAATAAMAATAATRQALVRKGVVGAAAELADTAWSLPARA